MNTWVATVAKDNTAVSLKGAAKMVQVQASNLTTALKRAVEEGLPDYGPRRSYAPCWARGGKLPPSGALIVIRIHRVAKS